MVPYGEAATAIQGTQQEVIDRVLGELAKRTYGAGGRLRKGSGKNVLLSGDKVGWLSLPSLSHQTLESITKRTNLVA